jgi:hypothetical protein
MKPQTTTQIWNDAIAAIRAAGERDRAGELDELLARGKHHAAMYLAIDSLTQLLTKHPN